MSYLSRRFHQLREIGGDGYSQLHMKIAKKQPGHNLTRYESLFVRVELMIPFTFNGHDLVSVVQGEDLSSCVRTVMDITELAPTLVSMRKAAFDNACRAAAEDIDKLMREVRPTVSNRKVLKKARATLKRFDAWWK